jgi:GNAT superfamily N-acetyltransferase
MGKSNDTQAVDFRLLKRQEIRKFIEIDRKESFEGVFFWRSGALVHKRRHWDLPDWSIEEKEKIKTFEKEFDNSAIVVGAFIGSTLIGFAITKPIVVEDKPGVYELQQIVVSEKYRRKKVGTKLVSLTSKKALEFGAKTICLLSTPAEPAIRFYLAVGFKPGDVPADGAFSWWDGEDVYMEMTL